LNIVGIYIEGNTTTGNEIICNDISSNSSGVYCESNIISTAATIKYNNITGNTGYGVDNISSNTIDATRNWWGSSTGPMHSGNIGGIGDKVSDYVNYDSYISALIENKVTTTITTTAVSTTTSISSATITTTETDTVVMTKTKTSTTAEGTITMLMPTTLTETQLVTSTDTQTTTLQPSAVTSTQSATVTAIVSATSMNTTTSTLTITEQTTDWTTTTILAIAGLLAGGMIIAILVRRP
jgi:hypothetical protein